MSHGYKPLIKLLDTLMHWEKITLQSVAHVCGKYIIYMFWLTFKHILRNITIVQRQPYKHLLNIPTRHATSTESLLFRSAGERHSSISRGTAGEMEDHGQFRNCVVD